MGQFPSGSFRPSSGRGAGPRLRGDVILHMEISNQLTMDGELDTVYDYAAHVERWPEILPHYRRVEIIEAGERERLVAMHCVRSFGFVSWPCKWRARQELRPEEGRILFCHVAGPARGMRVEWLIEAVPEGA